MKNNALLKSVEGVGFVAENIRGTVRAQNARVVGTHIYVDFWSRGLKADTWTEDGTLRHDWAGAFSQNSRWRLPSGECVSMTASSLASELVIRSVDMDPSKLKLEDPPIESPPRRISVKDILKGPFFTKKESR